MKPNAKPQWSVKPKYTFEDMLDQPWKMHSSPGKPAAHITRQCDFVKRIAKGEALHLHPHHHLRTEDHLSDRISFRGKIPHI